jgi:hypothetical protein
MLPKHRIPGKRNAGCEKSPFHFIKIKIPPHAAIRKAGQSLLPAPNFGTTILECLKIWSLKGTQLAFFAEKQVLIQSSRSFTPNMLTARRKLYVRIRQPISSAQVDFEFVLVQPGLKKEGLTEELANILASSSDYLLRGNYKAMRVMSSYLPYKGCSA